MRVLPSFAAVSLLLLRAALPLCAEGALFCTEEGTVLRYERRYADTGKLKWTHTLSILEVRQAEDGVQVECSSLFSDSGGRTLNGGPVLYRTAVSASGDVTADPSEAVVSVFRNRFPDGAVKSEPCISVLGSSIAPGDSLPDLGFRVSVAGIRYDVRISDRKVLRFESVATAAGKFDCVVVSEHKVEKAPGYRRETTALTWYAAGVGMVRHDTYDKKLRMETSEVLCEKKSVCKGCL